MAKRTWVLRNPEIVANLEVAIQEAVDSGNLFRVTLEPYRKPRSLEQNNTLHMWIHEIATATGHSNEEVKDWIKNDFYPKKETIAFGSYRVIPKSTSELTLNEMMDVMTQVQAWAINFDIEITEPDPMHNKAQPTKSAKEARND